MAVKNFNPTTPSRRHMTVMDYASSITRTKPEKSLIQGKKSTGGRNNSGRITVRFRGAGNKRRYRMVDFLRTKEGVPAKVVSIEYDPNRSANIALINYADGEKSYIIAPVGLNICCLEMTPGRGAVIARSAGQVAVLRGKEEVYAQVRLPSGEVRMIHLDCRAMIGQVGNLDQMNVKLGKAGKKRYLGFRPHVRGVAMNPVDHPMGGGEGRTSGGGHPVSPWGQLAKGKRTRNPKKTSKNFIVERRKK